MKRSHSLVQTTRPTDNQQKTEDLPYSEFGRSNRPQSERKEKSENRYENVELAIDVKKKDGT